MSVTASKRKSPLRGALRVLKWLIAVGAIGGLVALAFVPKPVEVDVAEIQRGSMRETVDDDGETRVRERYVVSAPLMGHLSRMSLEAGDPVGQGEVLAILDPSASDLLDPRTLARAEAAVRTAEAAQRSAEVDVETRGVEVAQREREHYRNVELHEGGSLAVADLEASESALSVARHAREAAEARVEVARFEVEQARAALERFGEEDVDEDWQFEIRSPIDGLVLRVHEESRRMVNAGASLLEVGDPTDLELRIDILSQDAVKVRPGQRVIVDHWGGDEALEAVVRRVEPSAFTEVSALGVDEQRVIVIADFDDLGDRRLGDGYRIEARIVIWEGEGVAQVPAGALFREADGWAVYRVDGDHARLTPVELGRHNGEVGELVSGLSEGDPVVLHPGDRITDGTLIKPRE